MALILLALLIGVPLIEIAVFIQVGGLIGLWPTLLTVIVTAIVGASLLRRQGLSTLARAQAELDAGRPPVKELFDGVCLLVGGALLLTPGFVTDAVGFALLVPPIRAVLGRWAWQAAAKRGGIHFTTMRGSATRGPSPHGPGGDATIVDVDDYTVEPDGTGPQRQVPPKRPDPGTRG